jgi:hypothetical protein
MAKYLLLSLVLLAQALVELDPITEEEKHDEVAQAQERSVWIACLFLAYTHIDVASETLNSFQQESGHSISLIKRKVSSRILDRCSSSITWKEAEEILSSTPGINDQKYDELSAIDLENFSPELTESEKALVDKIENFINLKHEDLFPPPPKIQGEELFVEEKDWTWLAYPATIVLIPVTWLLLKALKGSASPSTDSKQSESSKKRVKKSK